MRFGEMRFGEMRLREMPSVVGFYKGCSVVGFCQDPQEPLKDPQEPLKDPLSRL